MLMNEQEQEARQMCAWCNWVKECKDCPHRKFPQGKWLKEPLWDWKECQEWRYYAKEFKSLYYRLKERLRSLFGNG